MIGFDYDLFQLLCEKACRNLEMENRLDDVLGIFRIFFSCYRVYAGEDHPPVSLARLEKYIPMLFTVGNRYHRDVELLPEDYPAIITEYFCTRYQRRCDHRLFHFLSSDDIRINIMYKLEML